MYLAFWDVVFVCVVNDVCEDGVCRVVVECHREGRLAVCSELCPVFFPIVRECVSVLLYFVFGACVKCCGYGKVD